MKLSISLVLAAQLAVAAETPSSFGVTVTGQPMLALPGNGALRVLVVGGLDGGEASVAAARREAAKRSLPALLHRFGDAANLQFPPPSEAYGGPAGEAHYLWRHILQRAPDHVYVAGESPAADRLAAALKGKIPVTIVPPDRLGKAIGKTRHPASPWRLEIDKRLARTPEQVARQLAVPYGHDLTDTVYIPAMALIGRLRLGALEDVERIVAPYASGETPSLTAKATASHESGHLLFGELFKLTKKPAYLKLVLAAAGMAFEADGSMKEAMPLHNEMSDSFFMGCPILAQAGRLTGEAKYYDMALRHFRFMQKLDLRPDGLYRHSPLDEAAWGRGNGFPALGMALTLTELPADHPARPEVLAAFQSHLRALLRHQDDLGAWHEVIDHPESYPEYTATAMIGFALTRALRNGWVKGAAFELARDAAWQAVKRRTAEDGVLMDVCASTGKQKSLRDYYDRQAIFAVDPRGGAMGLLLATELMQ